MRRRFSAKTLVVLPIILVTMCISLLTGHIIYNQYMNELIEKEEEQLLAMARTIGKSLIQYVEQELDEIDLYFETIELISVKNQVSLPIILEQLQERQPELFEAICCYDETGRLIFSKGVIPVSLDQTEVTTKTRLFGKYQSRDNSFRLIVARTCILNETPFLVEYSLKMEEIYRQIVQPVRIGLGGYSVVKDSDLRIIMHHARSQLGMDALYDRSKKYPQIDLSDLDELIQMQKTQSEGSSVINSYKWEDENNLIPEKRIVAYTTIDLPGDTWIVNSTLPFQELDIPLIRMYRRLIVVGGILLLILLHMELVAVLNFMREKSSRKEIEYLREINQGMELLRKKEEEIDHYQRVQSIGEMSSHIAHEFNNYLTPIVIYGELLESDPDITPSQQEMVREILHVTEKASGLSRKLLDFSRQDSAIRKEPINLSAELERTCRVISQLLPEDVCFEQKIPSEDCFVYGCRDLTESILMNLSKNALHAMEKNGKKEKVFSLSLLREEGHAILEVTDTGCGIPKEALTKIFEPFYTTKRSGKGTGLGLSVVKNLMTACEGSVEIKSRVGEGTTFLLTFISCEQAAEHSVVKNIPEGLKNGRSGFFIIDDDPFILKSLKAEMRRNGIRCFFYDHPAAALAAIRESPSNCKVLLTDYDMPGMNGIELSEIVRKLNPESCILLMTGMETEQFSWYVQNNILDHVIPKKDLSKQLEEIFKF